MHKLPFCILSFPLPLDMSKIETGQGDCDSGKSESGFESGHSNDASKTKVLLTLTIHFSLTVTSLSNTGTSYDCEDHFYSV